MAAKLNRLQVEMTEAKLTELEEYRRAGGLKSKRELWDVAFTLLKWAAKKKAQGAAIGSFTETGGFKELEMPFLEDYATSQKEQADIDPEFETGKVAKPALVKVAAKSASGSGDLGSPKAIGEKRRRTA